MPDSPRVCFSLVTSASLRSVFLPALSCSLEGSTPHLWASVSLSVEMRAFFFSLKLCTIFYKKFYWSIIQNFNGVLVSGQMICFFSSVVVFVLPVFLYPPICSISHPMYILLWFSYVSRNICRYTYLQGFIASDI